MFIIINHVLYVRRDENKAFFKSNQEPWLVRFDPTYLENEL